MNGTQDSSQNEDRSPPPGFRSLLSIMEMSNEELYKQPLVDVIGIVTDCQPPMACRFGKDWKMTVSLVDLSIEDHGERYVLKLNIFKPPKEMPPLPSVGQPMVVSKAKVQTKHGAISLLSNIASEFTYFPPNKPKWPPSSIAHLPDPSFTTKINNPKAPNKPIAPEIQTYIAMLQNNLRPDSMPTKIAYEASTSMARNIKDKFSELKDVIPGRYHDLLCQVVSVHRVRGEIVTVYLTDYTVSDQFYDIQKIDADVVVEEAGDEYGYLRGKKLKPQKTNDGKEWTGPSGKMSIQLTAWDAQGDYFEDHAKPQDWVKIQNVHIKISNKTGCLEGAVHTDRKYPNKLMVQVLQVPQSGESIDPRWKNAIRRMKEYEREHRHEKKYGDIAAEAGGKRKAETEAPMKPPNAKKRREEKRKAAELKAKQGAEQASHKDVFTEKKAPSIRLNELVTAKASSDPASKEPITLTDILDFRPNLKLEDGRHITAPFTNSKYRAYVRVTDFFPHNLADFAVGRQASIYDALSDNESESDSEDDDLGRRNGDMTDYIDHQTGQWTWKWKFMIQVEDARRPDQDSTKPKPRMWLGVDNGSGQFLLNSDACNLRADKTALNRIKEKLFILWGDLEERKTSYLASEGGRILQSRTFAIDTGTPPASPTQPSTFQSSPITKDGRQNIKLGDMPADSDDEESSMPFATQQPLPSPSNPNSPKKLKKLRPKEAGKRLEERLRGIGEEAMNKPFEACIREWGVESEGGYRRAWGLFDTIIKY